MAEEHVAEGFAPRTGVRTSVTAALFAALLAVSAWISIPVGTVPVTLQVFIVFLAGLLLTPRAAFSAAGVYLLLGAIGLPVFAGAVGGLGVLGGPTGGYLWGFAAGAAAVAAVRLALARRIANRSAGEAIALAVGIVVIYAAGWFHLALVTGMGPWQSFMVGVAPFVPLDVVKAFVALGVAGALRRAGFAS